MYSLQSLKVPIFHGHLSSQNVFLEFGEEGKVNVRIGDEVQTMVFAFLCANRTDFQIYDATPWWMGWFFTQNGKKFHFTMWLTLPLLQ